LIAVKRDFDVDVISTRHGLRTEHECVRVECSEYSYNISAVYLALDVGKPAYDMFVKDMDAIVGSSRVTDRILVFGDFNYRKSSGGSRRMDPPCYPWASRLILRVI
jgi:hypothetical protein